MLKFLTLSVIGLTVVFSIIVVSLTSCKPIIAMDVSGEIQRNLLIGSGKEMQGQFIIGYTKISHKPSDIDFEIVPALADEINLRTRLSATAEPTKLDSDAILDMPIFIITGMGKMRFTNAEQSHLKTYLAEKGGFLMVDARDSDFRQSILSVLRKLFPDKPLQDITAIGQSQENWYEINGRRFEADVLRLDGRISALIPRNMSRWEFRNLDINNPAVQFCVNAVTYAVTHSPMVERHEYTPVTLTAHKSGDGIEVKAKVISHNAKDFGVLTLELMNPSGRIVAEHQQGLTLSNEKAEEYKTLFPKQTDKWLGKYRLKYSWQTNQYQYAGNVSLGELIGELDTRVLGQTQWYAGSPASLRVIALNHTTQSPIAGAEVNAKVVMRETEDVVADFSGETDNRGTVEMRFNAPEELEGSAELQVKVDSPMGTDEIKQEISIVKTHKLLLSTDKPLYQPGQTIHIRSLALNATTLKPIGNSQITLEVEDSKGNKVFKYVADTDKFGIAAADFNLADEINMGRYTVRAILGKVIQEKKVTVDRYVLPKFKIDFKTDKDFYQPSETVKGELQADYFFGKPVADGKVTIKASKFDVSFDEFAQVEGETDKNGHYTFELNLPSHFVGQPLEQGNTFVMFEISVIDGAEHEENISQNRSVVKSPITIVIIPESGDIVPNVENIIYVMTTYPDGKPAKTTVEVQNPLPEGEESQKLKSRTDSLGVAT
ncbi:MAG: MG2 domain-containing protein, partial [Candidatus Poribacteria bacterium]